MAVIALLVALIFAGCTSPCGEFCQVVQGCRSLGDEACRGLCEQAEEEMSEDMTHQVVDCMEKRGCQMLSTDDLAIDTALECASGEV